MTPARLHFMPGDRIVKLSDQLRSPMSHFHGFGKGPMSNTKSRCFVVVCLALAIQGCAGIGAGYKTPASATQVDFDVLPVTPELLEGLRIDPPARNANAPDSGPYYYRIGSGDVLSIYISQLAYNNPSDAASQSDEGQNEYAVSDSGEIFLPLHGPLNVRGLTIGETYSAIQSAIGQFINNPQINLRVTEFRSQRLTVAGAVDSPGFYPITDRPLSITEAVIAAGATKESNLREVVLKRNGDQTVLDVFALMESATFGRAWVLQDQDVIVVPRNENKVFVLGEAPNRVQSIDPYDNSLANILVDSGSSRSGGGASAGYLQAGAAKPSHVFVIRGSGLASGLARDTATVYHLNASKPHAMLLASKFQLSDEDIVFVATRRVTRYNRFLSQILPTLQTLLVPALLVDQFED